MERPIDIDSARVVMVSGVSGSGKTTFARRLEGRGFRRLSIDCIIAESHGVAGKDYPEENYRDYMPEAEEKLLERLRVILESGGKAVIDFTFCKRAVRNRYREAVRSLGAEPLLVYCSADLDTLKERLRLRNLTPGPDAAVVTDAMVERFYAGFERPGSDEPHIVI